MTVPSMLAGLGDYFEWWQGIMLILLIVVIVFWVWYRRKQM